MNNPYVERTGLTQPQMFHGRTYELDEIANFIGHNQSVSIVGQRRIGKTSLMQHLIRADTWAMLKLGTENLLVYQDCGILASGEETEVLSELCVKVAAALRTADLEAEPALKQVLERPTKQTFRQAMRKLKQRGLRPVLMLDEFEQLAANPKLDSSFYIGWRAIASSHDLVFLTASARPLIDLTLSEASEGAVSSPFFNIFHVMHLGLLAETEARALIRTPMQAGNIDVSPGLEEFIYKLVGGHPLGLQIACYHAWSNPDDLGQIERRTMEALDQHFEYYWKHLSIAEQKALRDPVATGALAAEDSGVREVLRDLTLKCLLVQKDGLYEHSSRAWAEYVSAQPHDSVITPAVPPPVQIVPGDAPKNKRSFRELLWDSIPEMIGGLVVTLVGGVVWLLFHWDDPEVELVKTSMSNIDWGIWIWAMLSILLVGVVAIGITRRRKRRKAAAKHLTKVTQTVKPENPSDTMAED